jgi:hypothetical protein
MTDGSGRRLIHANAYIMVYSILTDILLCFRTHCEEHGEGDLVAIDLRGGEEGAGLLRDPGLGAEEDGALGLLFGDEDAGEADVVDDDAVGQVGNVECDAVVEVVALDAKVTGDGAAGGDGDFGEGGEGLWRGNTWQAGSLPHGGR